MAKCVNCCRRTELLAAVLISCSCSFIFGPNEAPFAPQSVPQKKIHTDISVLQYGPRFIRLFGLVNSTNKLHNSKGQPPDPSPDFTNSHNMCLRPSINIYTYFPFRSPKWSLSRGVSLLKFFLSLFHTVPTTCLVLQVIVAGRVVLTCRDSGVLSPARVEMSMKK